jgi:hypothetical protein
VLTKKTLASWYKRHLVTPELFWKCGRPVSYLILLPSTAPILRRQWKGKVFSIGLPSHSGPSPLIQFCNHFSQTAGLLGRVISPSQGLHLNTGQHKHRINTYTHQTSFLKWDSNPRSQRPGERRQFMPYTSRLLWPARMNFYRGLIKCHAMKTYGKVEFSSTIVDFGTRWSWVISFTPWPI